MTAPTVGERDPRASVGLPWTVDVHGKEGRLALHGELDLATRSQLDEALLQLIARGVASIVVDLRGVTFLDCAGLRPLVAAAWAVGRLGGCLRVEHPRGPVERVLRLTGVDLALGLAPDPAAR